MRLQDLKDDLERFGDLVVANSERFERAPALVVARRVADLFEQEPDGRWNPSKSGFEVLTEHCYEGTDVVGSLACYLFGEDT